MSAILPNLGVSTTELQLDFFKNKHKLMQLNIFLIEVKSCSNHCFSFFWVAFVFLLFAQNTLTKIYD